MDCGRCKKSLDTIFCLLYRTPLRDRCWAAHLENLATVKFKGPPDSEKAAKIGIVNKNEFLKLLDIEHPIIQGPMGGGPSTPELVAAVSNAGGLGSLGAAYLTPDQISDAIRRTRALTSRPFNVNLFAGGWNIDQTHDAGPMLERLAEVHEKLGLPAPVAPTPTPDPFPSQLEAVLDARPPIFSFTFGIPDRDQVSRLKSRGIIILGTATTVEEARCLEQAGVDAVVAQGSEAGAHRGTFLDPSEMFDSSMIPTLDLVRATAGAVSLPVIATGGLMDGRDIVAALKAGAAAAQLGTAFLACPESGASEVYKRAILAAKQDTTVVTRAFSGRPARGLRNTFIARLDGRPNHILPYPLQNALTRHMRTAAAQQGLPDYLSLWAGQGVARARAMPAGDLVASLLI
jgi:nitronate monooxygenase